MKSDLQLHKLEKIQDVLSKKVQLNLPSQFTCNIVAGFDISYSKKTNLGIAATVCVNMIDKKIIETQYLIAKPRIPYIPTFLGFREIPFFYKLMKQLKSKPDLVMIDGFGILHPRGFGSASHFGVLTKIPTIGIGKTQFFGTILTKPQFPGEWTPITVNNRTMGALLKPHIGKSIYVSPGNLIDLKSAVDITYSMIDPDKRLPKPIHCADKYSRKILSELE